MLDQILLLRPDMPQRRVGDEGVVVLQDEAEVLVVNDVGCRILELAREQISVKQIIERLQPEYQVSRDVLEADVKQFVRQLLSEGLASLKQAEQDAPGL